MLEVFERAARERGWPEEIIAKYRAQASTIPHLPKDSAIDALTLLMDNAELRHSLKERSALRYSQDQREDDAAFATRILEKFGISVEDKVKEREGLRMNKDFAGADKIRQELNEVGIAIIDHQDGTSSWEYRVVV